MHEDTRTIEQPAEIDPWGWSRTVRGLLLGLAVLLACGLAVPALEDGASGDVPEVRLRVDLNSAPPTVLTALPHLGPARVAEIVKARQEGDPFRSMADLHARVRGIGPSTAATLAPHVRFPATTPLPSNAEPALSDVPSPSP